ncbi:DUF4153 domain-containing protein [Streptomyces sp. NPDC127084]|uniref:DUF4153 domain-containing protein n=1 Tax=Streptomyces sp. NPDC127084 TaxID=3347133 RepID=UPI00365F7730
MSDIPSRPPGAEPAPDDREGGKTPRGDGTPAAPSEVGTGAQSAAAEPSTAEPPTAGPSAADPSATGPYGAEPGDSQAARQSSAPVGTPPSGEGTVGPQSPTTPAGRARATGPADTTGKGAVPVGPPGPRPPAGAGHVPAATWPPAGRPWPPPVRRPEPLLARIRPAPPAPIRAATLWCVLATALLSALLLGDGVGVNLLIVAVPAALAAYFAAQSTGRRPRPWTMVWIIGVLVLLAVPALSDAGWPSLLAVVSAIAAGSIALHGGRSWPGVLLAPAGLFDSLVGGTAWAWRGMRERYGSRGRSGPVVRTIAVAVGLLIVFGALFAGADAAFADLLGELIPDVSLVDGPWRFFLFLVGLLTALAMARTAAAPLGWDRMTVRGGKPRGRFEWAVPLMVLNLLFAAFIAVQLAVLFGGYDKVLSETGLTYAEYARQGFWQLLWATVLVLVVIGLALRWAPRSGPRDHALVRGVLGALCLLTLVVVASALRRMDLYVDAYGLTRLRVSVAAMELWLGLVIILIIGAELLGRRWLPRAVVGSAVAAVLAFGLAAPDALIAERGVQRHKETGKIDIVYLGGLSADAVPALDRLPEPLRSCALAPIARDLERTDDPWYATSWSQVRARSILSERPVDFRTSSCPDDVRPKPAEDERDPYADEYDEHDGEYDPGTGMD